MWRGRRARASCSKHTRARETGSGAALVDRLNEFVRGVEIELRRRDHIDDRHQPRFEARELGSGILAEPLAGVDVDAGEALVVVELLVDRRSGAARDVKTPALGFVGA